MVSAPGIYEYWGTTVMIVGNRADVRYHSNQWAPHFNGISVSPSASSPSNPSAGAP
jgi:hypothetical protein